MYRIVKKVEQLFRFIQYVSLHINLWQCVCMSFSWLFIQMMEEKLLLTGIEYDLLRKK